MATRAYGYGDGVYGGHSYADLVDQVEPPPVETAHGYGDGTYGGNVYGALDGGTLRLIKLTVRIAEPRMTLRVVETS